jgi:hypothetical protein
MDLGVVQVNESDPVACAGSAAVIKAEDIAHKRRVCTREIAKRSQ